jgi:hypothetical protein
VVSIEELEQERKSLEQQFLQIQGALTYATQLIERMKAKEAKEKKEAKESKEDKNGRS